MLSDPFSQVLLLYDLTRQRQETFEGPGQEGVGVSESRVEAAVTARPGERGAPCVWPG